MCCSHVQPLLLAGATSAPFRSWRPRPPQREIRLETGVSTIPIFISMIPIFIGVAWLNLVTMVIAACRAAAHADAIEPHADAIELEILVQACRAGGSKDAASESLSYHAHVVGRGHQSTLGRTS